MCKEKQHKELVGYESGMNFQKRGKYWSREVEEFFHSERTLDELHHWLREKGQIYTFNEK